MSFKSVRGRHPTLPCPRSPQSCPFPSPSSPSPLLSVPCTFLGSLCTCSCLFQYPPGRCKQPCRLGLQGLVNSVLLEDSELPSKLLMKPAAKLRELCDSLGLRLIIENRVDVAVNAKADGLASSWPCLPVG